MTSTSSIANAPKNLNKKPRRKNANYKFINKSE